jgi:type II secretory pathway pseudopilin PulG
MIFGQKKKWFTLVEMLIVIVIIWVLAAALIPRLTSVRWRANDVARKADIQQLTTAILAYQMDFNGKYPDPGTGNYSISSIKNALITAWMDGLPLDPTTENVFNFSWNSISVLTWEYGYIRITKDGLANEWFVLMAKTQTAWWSNRVVSGSIWTISPSTNADSLKICRTIIKSWAVANNLWDCAYTSAAELRYIIVR